MFFIAGALLMQQLLTKLTLKKWQYAIVWAIFFGSFLLEPVNQLKDQMFLHKSIFDTAEQMRLKKIEGSFTSNERIDECMVYAYLTKNQFYAISKPSFYMEELVTELKLHKVKYYFFYYQSQQQKEEFLKGTIANNAVGQVELGPGLLVFQLY